MVTVSVKPTIASDESFNTINVCFDSDYNGIVLITIS